MPSSNVIYQTLTLYHLLDISIFLSIYAYKIELFFLSKWTLTLNPRLCANVALHYYRIINLPRNLFHYILLCWSSMITRSRMFLPTSVFTLSSVCWNGCYQSSLRIPNNTRVFFFTYYLQSLSWVWMLFHADFNRKCSVIYPY